MILINIILILIMLVIIPGGCGQLLMREGDAQMLGIPLGYVYMLAAYLPVALIVTFARAPFMVLTVVWLIIVIVSAALGTVRLIKAGAAPRRGQMGTGLKIIWAIIIALILYQMIFSTVFMHTDADDSWYVATAVTDIYTNTVGQFAPDTGAVASFALQQDYILNPWPVMLGSLSVLTGLHPAVLAHSILPFFLIFASYCAYYMLAKHLFKDDSRRIAIFMLVLIAAVMFGFYSTRSLGVVMLIRSWQGKALAASLGMPLVILFAATVNDISKGAKNYINLMLANAAVICCSGLWMILSGLMVACFILVGIFKVRSARHTGKMILAMLPSIIVGALFILIGRM